MLQGCSLSLKSLITLTILLETFIQNIHWRLTDGGNMFCGLSDSHEVELMGIGDWQLTVHKRDVRCYQADMAALFFAAVFAVLPHT